MPAAVDGDTDQQSPLDPYTAELRDDSLTYGTSSFNKHAQAEKAILRENVNVANTSQRSSEPSQSSGSVIVQKLRNDERSQSKQPSNGWQESESSTSSPKHNGWTEVRSRGSIRSKVLGRRVQSEATNEEAIYSSPLRDEADTAKVSKLSPDKLIELISSPDALPVQSPRPTGEGTPSARNRASSTTILTPFKADESFDPRTHANGTLSDASPRVFDEASPSPVPHPKELTSERPLVGTRATSTPLMKRKVSSNKTVNGITPISIPKVKSSRTPLEALHARDIKGDSKTSRPDDYLSSPIPPSIPLPPLSVPTHLHLELSSRKPSPLYVYRSPESDFPYEATHVKLERLLNFLLLPPQLEQVLWFGALACLDAWLYTFTILPIRFGKASSILIRSWVRNIMVEVKFVMSFIYSGIGRMWERNSKGPVPTTQGTPNPKKGPLEQTMETPSASSPMGARSADIRSIDSSLAWKTPQAEGSNSRPMKGHRRIRSEPSNLLPVEKADILKGLLILISCYILMYFDASMMYHNIRGQAAMKLYVIYNALEVFDRLFSALGQDILECLFAKETLDRKPNGRSKILRPLWLFLLALVYNIVHSTALFYQVITLNVAVNSYSNALLTLLMSNQFVEIKSTVFKKIEKENLFQMTCADVVERFQLWLMLIIIAARNVVETGGLPDSNGSSPTTTDSTSGLLPHSFTLLPEWVGQVMSPFFFVLGTEMLVDWIKHAYITKFNATKPNIYGRFLDVLAKDYYSNAFTDPNLTRRVGLPTIPLSCLFIRASVQTYHMFLATHSPSPPSSSLATSLTEDYATPSATPAITAAIQHIDRLFKRAIFGSLPLDPATTPSTAPSSIPFLNSLPCVSSLTAYLPALDTLLTHLTTATLFALLFLVLLTLKLLLGMVLLSLARRRYVGMKAREAESASVDSKRVGGWGVVETGDERRRWIYRDDEEGLRRVREREKEREKEREGGKDKEGGAKGKEKEREGKGLAGVERYAMVGKRIW